MPSDREVFSCRVDFNIFVYKLLALSSSEYTVQALGAKNYTVEKPGVMGYKLQREQNIEQNILQKHFVLELILVGFVSIVCESKARKAVDSSPVRSGGNFLYGLPRQ